MCCQRVELADEYEKKADLVLQGLWFPALCVEVVFFLSRFCSSLSFLALSRFVCVLLLLVRPLILLPFPLLLRLLLLSFFFFLNHRISITLP